MLQGDAILSETPITDTCKTPTDKLTRPKPKGDYIPDKSHKRILSVGSTPSPTFITQIDKKLRSDSEFEWPTATMEPEVTLADIMSQLRLTAKASDLVDLATKKDVQEIQGIVTSHTLELQQIKQDMLLHAKRLQQLEENLGQQAARLFNKTPPDVDFTRSRQDGGAQSSFPQTNLRKKNLVFEGLPSLSDRDTVDFVIQLCSAIDIIAYQSDFESVVPMRRRDGSKKPAPILITFEQHHVRSAILRKKYKLAATEKYASVYINMDEPIEVRRAKAVFRRIGYQARLDGRSVTLKDDLIRIDEDEYRITDLKKIPEKYRLNLEPPTSAATDPALQSKKNPNAPTPPTRQKRIKIKMTKAGLTFSGPSAFLSHMHRCSFTYKKEPYSSVEQGFHHLHAEFEGEHDIARTILSLHNAYDIMDAAKPLPASEEWSKMAPGQMWDLN